MTEEKSKSAPITVEDLLNHAIQNAKQDGEYIEIVDELSIDYETISKSHCDMVLSSPDFGIYPIVEYGASEGIYAELYIKGWRGTNTAICEQIYTIKTLRADKRAFLLLGRYANLIAYHANEFVINHVG